MSALKVSTSRRRQAGVEAVIQRITPQMAEKMLGKNVKNRIVRASAVSAYARDMARGEWRLTGEAIKFDSDGNLIDGQHRLLAVITANVSVDMLVITGLPPESQQYLDSGRKRTHSDQLRLSGETQSALLASAARQVWLWDTGNMSENVLPTFAEVAEVIDDEPDLRLSVATAAAARSLIPVAPTALALAIHLCSRIDREAATEFFVHQVANGESMSAAARALSQRLTKAMITKQRLTKVEQIGYLLRAWNLWRAKESTTRLQAPKGVGWLPSNLPTPR